MNVSARKRITTTMAVFMLLTVTIGVHMSGKGETRQEYVLRVGETKHAETTNILRLFPDSRMMGALAPVYDTVGRLTPEGEEPLPYLLRGVDADDSGMFDLDEYGVYEKDNGMDPLEVTAYYDFNGVHSHDGVQMTVDDLLFSHHLEALDPQSVHLDVITDKHSLPGSNYSTTRWLNVWPVGDSWDSSIPVGANETLTFALHFSLQSTYANFVRFTLNTLTIMPRHIWEGTGKVCVDAAAGVCGTWNENIHPDFGHAYDPAAHNGVPASDPDAYIYGDAESWVPDAEQVIGTGPFKLVKWDRLVSKEFSRYEDYKVNTPDCERVGDPPVCKGTFFSYLHRPYIDGMLFKTYGTSQATVFALMAGEIDIVPGSTPVYLSDLLYDPDIGISNAVERGYWYLGYNMRGSPLGYPDNDPSKGDHGLYLRKAISHGIDKQKIVTTLLQNFGAVGDQPISPYYSRWYNESVTRYEFNLSLASQILDDHYTEGGLGLGYGSSGYRNLPTIRDRGIEITCLWGYDFPRGGICALIESNMRRMGINATVHHVSLGELIEVYEDRTFEMWLGYGMFGFDFMQPYCGMHSASSGNYPGWQNETYDRIVEDLRRERDSDRQAELIKWLAGLLADALPIDVLYYKTKIEPYRSDRFVNWTAGPDGSIFWGSYWSWIGIHPPPKPTMVLSVSAPSAVESMGTSYVKAALKRFDGTPVSGRTVELCMQGPIFPGNLTIGEVTDVCVLGTSDLNGVVRARYEAPDVEGPEPVLVWAIATSKGDFWDYYEASTFIRVYPKEKQFLLVSIAIETSDIVQLGGFALIRVDVRDKSLSLVDGATVRLRSVPSGLTFRPDNVSTVYGNTGTVSVSAPLTMSSDSDYLSFNIIAEAELDDYEPGIDAAEIIVFRSEAPPPSGPEIPEARVWQYALLGVMLAAVSALALIRLIQTSARGRHGRRRE